MRNEIVPRIPRGLKGEKPDPKDTGKEPPKGFRSLNFPKSIVPDRKFEDVNLAKIRQLVIHGANQPVENRMYIRAPRYYIEGEDGQFIDVMTSGLTLSKEHVARIDSTNDEYADMFIVFPDYMVEGAKQYGELQKRPIFDMGVKVGESNAKLVKLRLYYKDISDVFGGKEDTKKAEYLETVYRNMDHIRVPV